MRADELFAQLNAENPEIEAIAWDVDPPFILAENVYRLRGERGLSQAELAREIGVAQPRIAEIEAGRSNPRLRTLARIAHALGVGLTELLADPAAGDTDAAEVAASEPPALRRRTG